MTTLLDLANQVGGRVVGDPSFEVSELRELHLAGPNDLSFLTNTRYKNAFLQTKAGAVLLGEAIPDACPNQIVCEDPYLAVAQIATSLYPQPTYSPGVHPSAYVAPSADVADSAYIGPNAVVMDKAVVGESAVIEAQAYLGPSSQLGAFSRLHPGVKILAGAKVGKHVILHSGAVIGSDGFGFAPDTDGVRHKIPQVGTVVIGDHCEIGANTTVDRATLGATTIGAGTKIDNLVQIAHNVTLGEHCVMASQSGIAGSTTVGKHVIMGAQVGVTGHVSICDKTTLAARAGVISSIKKPAVYAGTPSMPHRAWLKFKAHRGRIPEMRRAISKLEQMDQGLVENERKET